jgi:hypothetical protein
MFYLFEVRDSDGNDCSVFDVIVEAETKETASAQLWKHLEEQYPDDEGDGGFGTFHACDCACDHFVGNGQTPVVGICDDCADGWECSHGGLTTNEDAAGQYGPQEFATYNEALAAHARYHSLIDLS